MRRTLIMILLLVAICTTAVAETKTFRMYVYVYETLEEGNITFASTGGSAVKKNDGDQYFYLTPTSTNLLSGRNVYFRSMYSKSTNSSAIASGYVVVNKSTDSTKKAKYKSGMAVGNHTYYLAGAGQAIQDDPYLGNYAFQINGRWTP